MFVRSTWATCHLFQGSGSEIAACSSDIRKHKPKLVLEEVHIPSAYGLAYIGESKGFVRYCHFRRLRRYVVGWILAEVIQNKIQNSPICLTIHDWFQRTDPNTSV